DVVEADDRQVPGNPQARRLGDLHRRYGRQVVGGEYGGGPVLQGEELSGRLPGRFRGVATHLDELGVEVDAGLGEGPAIALLPQPGGLEVGPSGQEADPTVSQPDQVLGRRGRALQVL